jgi:phosphatidylserine/phosphatidylglycerophosphate/cardiolipin synthase-like enzyme
MPRSPSISKSSIPSSTPKAETAYIADSAHYDTVITELLSAKKHLWIGTADIKDLYCKQGRTSVPFLKLIAGLIKKGVEVRLIHAKEPGPAFRTDFDKYPELLDGMERMLCPRVHFKLIIIDFKKAYIGSANLTGAGIGMKGDNTRNFESGIFTSNADLVKAAQKQFDDVWLGAHCKDCKRKEFCPEPIV